MATILYEILRDDSVDPVEYYVEFVSREELSLEDMCYLINATESLITEATCRAVLMELQNVIADQLAAGNWILFDDFWLWQPELNDQLELPTEEPSYELAVACDIQSSVDNFVVTEGTFELLRYAFPVIPYITSCNDFKYLLDDLAIDGQAFGIYGEDFEIDPDDEETGVWFKEGSGTETKQDRFVMASDSEIVVVAKPTSTGNKVERTVLVKSRYEEGGDIQTGEYEFIRLPVSSISSGKHLFIRGSDTAGPVLVTTFTVSPGHTYEYFLFSAAKKDASTLTMKALSMPGGQYEEHDITANGSLTAMSSPVLFQVDVLDFATLMQSCEDYGGYIKEVKLG